MRRPGTRGRVLALLSLVTGLACASDVGVSTTYDPLTRFPAEAIYLWDASANSLPTDPRIRELDLGPLIQEAADQAFSARGYRRATGSSAHYRLSYELEVHTWIGADNSRSVGSISLLLTEVGSGRRVWVGFGRAEVNVALSREERRDRLRQAFSRVLAGFPPGVER